MQTYIHELDKWPHFFWDEAVITPLLATVSRRQGRLLGRMEGLGFNLRNEALLETLTEDVQKSSEIEGEILDKEQVRSSIARRLGMDIGSLIPADRHVEGVVEMMLDATQQFDATLDIERLYAWHAALFPTGRSGMVKINVGAWRTDETGPMQVISGAIGRERVHYQAPDAVKVADEMVSFLHWLEGGAATDIVLKAALAHLWYITIHPFDDGNGRIARAITDMMLARSERSKQRFYSMSAQIRAERSAYYEVLERTQKGGLDVTEWLHWFLNCLNHAFDGAENTLSSILAKAAFWDQLETQTISQRQQHVLNKLLDGFEGKLTTSKWAKLTKTSSDTALRDITDLVARGILQKDQGGGRSTSYSIQHIANST